MTDSPTTTAAIELLRQREAKGRATYGTTIDEAGLTVARILDHAIEEAADLLVYLLAIRRTMRQEQATPEPHRCTYCRNYPAITMREGWEIGGRIADVWAIDCGCERGVSVKGETLQSALAVWCHHNAVAEPVKQAQNEAVGVGVADSATDGALTADKALKVFMGWVERRAVPYRDCWVLLLYDGRYVVVYPDGRLGEACCQGGDRAPTLAEMVELAEEAAK